MFPALAPTYYFPQLQNLILTFRLFLSVKQLIQRFYPEVRYLEMEALTVKAMMLASCLLTEESGVFLFQIYHRCHCESFPNC